MRSLHSRRLDAVRREKYAKMILPDHIVTIVRNVILLEQIFDKALAIIIHVRDSLLEDRERYRTNATLRFAIDDLPMCAPLGAMNVATF